MDIKILHHSESTVLGIQINDQLSVSLLSGFFFRSLCSANVSIPLSNIHVIIRTFYPLPPRFFLKSPEFSLIILSVQQVVHVKSDRSVDAFFENLILNHNIRLMEQVIIKKEIKIYKSPAIIRLIKKVTETQYQRNLY